jgi:hypothetical protein
VTVEPRGPGSRREFLVALGGFPFFWRPRAVQLAGARFRIVRHRRSRNRYLRIHGDEETAREALIDHMRSARGTAFIVESHTRNVPILGGEIDPNRMFSRVGAEASLKRLNPNWTGPQIERSLDLLDRHREALLRAILPPPGGRLVALHNNARGYSVQDEIPISDRVSLSEPAQPHAFFLCTDARDYAVLAQSPYNVVLQQKPATEDDGSLSRLAAARHVRYVNLEVALGDLDRQRKMLQWLEAHLD